MFSASLRLSFNEEVFSSVIFYSIIFIYDLFRGLVPYLNQNVNYSALIDVERGLFGSIPTIVVQHELASHLAGRLGAVLALFYLSHFILPVLVLFFLWKDNRRNYYFAAVAILFTSYLSFATFLIFPAAPPWLASLNGDLPEVKQYLLINLDGLFSSNYLSDLYRSLSANPYAPFPSLHAAYPFLIFIISLKFIKKASLVFFVVFVVVSFALVAFGEHYVVDIFAGWVYALVSFIVTLKLFKTPVVSRYLDKIN